MSTPPVAVDAKYLALAKESLRSQFPVESEADIFTAIRGRHRHYLYTGFLEVFPTSSRREEVECLLRDFALFEATSPTVVPMAELVSRFNFNGEMKVAHWSKGMVAVTPMGIIGQPMIGNLQFLQSDMRGGIELSEQDIAIPKNARFIYPIMSEK